MVLRQCTVCGRRFTKTEHFKRHERSHTRERPYSCTICDKAFSRSDVLFRHMKCHGAKNAKTPTNPGTRRNTISEGVAPQPPQDEFDINSPTAVANASHTGIPLMQILSPSNYLPPHTNNSNQQARHASIDLSNPFLDTASTQSNSLGIQLPGTTWPLTSGEEKDPSTSQPQKPSPSQNSGEASTFETSVPTPGNPNQTPRSEIAPNQFSDGHIEWLPPSDQTNQNNFHDPFQMWLFPSLGDLDQSPDFLQTYGLGDLQHQYLDQKGLVNGTTSDPPDRKKTIEKVPRERFSRVQRCWGPRPGRNYRIMPNLWKEVALSPMDNLFSETPFAADDFRTVSNWGLDTDCRVRLRNTFHTPAPSAVHSPRLQAVVDPALSQANEEFPPAEILDIALGLFFRRFHPTVPFIHVATFSVRNTPTPMLFAICLIGLSILGTTGATIFVSRMFPSFLQRVCNDLSACAGCSATTQQQLAAFATALLTLNLSVITGEKDPFNQCQMLYVSLISMAQQNGLFAADEGQSLDALLAEMSESDDRWKAWSRIESAKRLILGLLLADSWFSNLLSKAPIIRSESVCAVAPCDEALFQAKSATQWQSLLRSGKSQSAPTFRIEDLHKQDMEPIGRLGYLGRSSLLALLQIQILEAYQRLMPSDQLVVGSFIPWHVYTGDARAKTTIPAVLAANHAAGPLAKVDDTNCVVLWHSLCIMLLADFRMFELAAGRHGAAPATGALENISQWSQTQAARRACVHAAQNFKLMSERRVSDNVTIHSVTALFSSALVLGLYLFMVNPESVASRQGTAPVELAESDPNWIELQDLGFRDESLDLQPERSLTTNREDEQFSPVYQFVKHGGTISLNGVVHQGGYESARRVLLDFANLMDGISGRRLRTFTQVLHIMSDDLMNVDPAL
ncbi:hypothetical protein HRR83_009487 [Exophiala dermatitidis]|uniref:C2H2-type domain-containing protein n=1 Tax=Exophiala dermatitidis TaxID=5970 RepID=A0AAN6EKS8_EXODE|nr:hypothetical protein HRR75_008793 [Exophiala dermatitidis]KAJ4502590.1 hypothetical protein HRR74_009555 [Exophiala dermatitidis]KAJ4510289.1 hypothetical protein HRR73_007087 [Exophiala dermatitidis]KAJ4531489.1 hypothetical protein HRR77_009421 [Exophiala dermatitidis]KAJ4535843.1 hypothetical protein HRR78_008747 [Exophiala dermatitidis]